MTFEKDLAGKAAIVTGASRNLGRGFAEALARRGANVVVHWNAAASRSDAEETAFRVKKAGAAAELVQADLADPAQASLLVERCLARFQRFDILINNAGLLIKKPFAEITDQDFERSFAINARSPFLLMRSAAVHMREEGRIINIGTSILGCSFPFYGIYAASKAALEHMSRALAKELASRRISVNTVAPGALDTAFFFAGETPDSAEAIKHFTGGLGRPEDVVPLVEYLLQPNATWMSGQTIFVNGGFVAR